MRKSSRELKIDLIGYYLAQGDIKQAKEVVEKMDDYRVIHREGWRTVIGERMRWIHLKRQGFKRYKRQK